MYLGNHQTALEHQHRAERLSPRAPNVWQVKMGLAFAHFFDGRYEEAVRLAERITDEFPTLMAAWRVMAASNALSGDLTSAAKATQRVLELDPSARVSLLVTNFPLRRSEDRERWREGLIHAGFPQ
jgi:adenylate cyclase